VRGWQCAGEVRALTRRSANRWRWRWAARAICRMLLGGSFGAAASLALLPATVCRKTVRESLRSAICS